MDISKLLDPRSVTKPNAAMAQDSSDNEQQIPAEPVINLQFSSSLTQLCAQSANLASRTQLLQRSVLELCVRLPEANTHILESESLIIGANLASMPGISAYVATSKPWQARKRKQDHERRPSPFQFFRNNHTDFEYWTRMDVEEFEKFHDEVWKLFLVPQYSAIAAAQLRKGSKPAVRELVSNALGTSGETTCAADGQVDPKAYLYSTKDRLFLVLACMAHGLESRAARCLLTLSPQALELEVHSRIVLLGSYLRNKFITWPNIDRRNFLLSLMRGTGLEGLLAVVDGTDSPAPHVSTGDQRRDYSGHKKKHRTTWQGTCDVFGLFVDVTVCLPGSFNDKTVSKKYTRYIDMVASPDFLRPGEWIAGDKGYVGVCPKIKTIHDVTLPGLFQSVRQVIEHCYSLKKSWLATEGWIQRRQAFLHTYITWFACGIHNWRRIHGHACLHRTKHDLRQLMLNNNVEPPAALQVPQAPVDDQ